MPPMVDRLAWTEMSGWMRPVFAGPSMKHPGPLPAVMKPMRPPACWPKRGDRERSPWIPTATPGTWRAAGSRLLKGPLRCAAPWRNSTRIRPRPLNVLRGGGPDNLPNPGYAEQTASAPRIKAIENRYLADKGYLTQGQAIQETARGYAKDMATKLTPLLESDPRVTPEQLDRLRRMQAVMEKAGRGEIPPGQVDGMLQKAVPEIEGLTLAKTTRIIDGNLEAAIKWRKPAPPRVNLGGYLSS